MNKSMLRTLALVLILALSPLTVLAEPAAFEFPGGIAWAHTADEVEAVYGEACERSDYGDEFVSLTRLQVQGAEIFGHESTLAVFMFIDEAFYGIVCLYEEAAVPDVQALADGITELYGDPAEIVSSTHNIFVDVIGHEQLFTWNLGSETEISVMDAGEEAAARYAVAIINVPVNNDFLSRMQGNFGG